MKGGGREGMEKEGTGHCLFNILWHQAKSTSLLWSVHTESTIFMECGLGCLNTVSIHRLLNTAPIAMHTHAIKARSRKCEVSEVEIIRMCNIS